MADMTHPNPSTALARVVIDELVRHGVTSVVASPGSRSTALVLAAAAHPEVELVVALDERSGGFHALGWSKQSGRPSAVITTSGTAVANLAPAVVEADLAGVPLVVLSADRPPEMRGVGANQAIDQLGMFVRFARLVLDLGPAEHRADAPRDWRSATSRAVAAARGFGASPGPVQLNVAFREPTVPVADDGRSREEPFVYDTAGRPDATEWSVSQTGRRPQDSAIAQFSRSIDGARRGIILAGPGSDESVVRLGHHLGWPVLATAESGLRKRADVIATGHHLAASVEPDLVVRFGTPGPSRRMLDLVSQPIPQLVVAAKWSDPGRVVSATVDADPGDTARAVMESVAPREGDRWAKWWEEADAAVRDALDPETHGQVTEPAVAATVGRAGADVITVASSMPIRDVEAYAFSLPKVVANRGASGIDGLVSTALGVAREADRSLALVGDLSLLHDSNGFLLEPRPSCVFVVVDNSGGGIFSFLPQAQHAGREFERLFGTPSGRDLSHLAALHDLAMTEVETTSDLESAVEEGWERGGCHLVVASTDRDENVAEHVRLNRLADEAVAAIPPPNS